MRPQKIFALSLSQADGKIQCLFDKLPLNDNSIDSAISVNSFGHFLDVKKAVMEMVRFTKNIIIVTSPNFTNPFLSWESLRRKSLLIGIITFFKKLFGVSLIFIYREYNNYKSDSDVCYELNAEDLEKWSPYCSFLGWQSEPFTTLLRNDRGPSVLSDVKGVLPQQAQERDVVN